MSERCRLIHVEAVDDVFIEIIAWKKGGTECIRCRLDDDDMILIYRSDLIRCDSDDLGPYRLIPYRFIHEIISGNSLRCLISGSYSLPELCEVILRLSIRPERSATHRSWELLEGHYYLEVIRITKSKYPIETLVLCFIYRISCSTTSLIRYEPDTDYIGSSCSEISVVRFWMESRCRDIIHTDSSECTTREVTRSDESCTCRCWLRDSLHV
jgi:hypothetical protein